MESIATVDQTVQAQSHWTTRTLVQWILNTCSKRLSRETIRLYLKRLGFSWKKAKKLLNRASPAKRKEFLERLKPLLKGATNGEHLLIYIDEAHIHQDTSLGYGWALKGERFWVSSSSPGLSEKVSFYGAYLYNLGQVRIFDYERANGQYTQEVLKLIRQEFPNSTIKIIWDGAPYHRAKEVYQHAGKLGMEIIQLPGYSPDFMPVEELWRWLREEITHFFCHSTQQQLIQAVKTFQLKINQNPFKVADRLWRTDCLDLNIEKLRVSN